MINNEKHPKQNITLYTCQLVGFELFKKLLYWCSSKPNSVRFKLGAKNKQNILLIRIRYINSLCFLGIRQVHQLC